MLPYTCIPVSIACYRHEPMQYITGIIDLFFEGPFFVFFMHAFMHDDDMVVFVSLVSAVAANFFDNGIHSFIHSFIVIIHFRVVGMLASILVSIDIAIFPLHVYLVYNTRGGRHHQATTAHRLSRKMLLHSHPRLRRRHHQVRRLKVGN